MWTERDVAGQLARMARPAIRAIEPYVWEASNHEIAARFDIDASQVIRFDTNTSPLPPPSLPSVLRMVEADPRVNEYFDAAYTSLVHALSEYIGLQPDHLLIGAGADEVLDVVAKTFLDPGDVVVLPVPTYAMYRIHSQAQGASIRLVDAHTDLGFDIDALIDAGA